ncbi:pentapeptide repeat-containing protein [Nonomuraea typhae]|uniref:Pentapeptide repeat-containing protein n=1 Tax=Nonomuraea typhae TaxID=2603600 RepID=A0ABW7YXP7_9ACTN
MRTASPSGARSASVSPGISWEAMSSRNTSAPALGIRSTNRAAWSNNATTASRSRSACAPRAPPDRLCSVQRSARPLLCQMAHRTSSAVPCPATASSAACSSLATRSAGRATWGSILVSSRTSLTAATSSSPEDRTVVSGLVYGPASPVPVLGWASSSGASLSGAPLPETSLSPASSPGASLCGASLSGASLSGASLSGASLSGALADAASFSAILSARRRRRTPIMSVPPSGPVSSSSATDSSSSPGYSATRSIVSRGRTPGSWAIGTSSPATIVGTPALTRARRSSGTCRVAERTSTAIRCQGTPSIRWARRRVSATTAAS